MTLLLAGCGGTAPSRVEVAAHPAPLSALESPDPTLAANKRLVFDMWRSIVNAGHVEVADDLLVEGYVQHSPVLPTGRNAFKQIFSVVPRRDIPVLVEPPLVASVAEGDLVVMSLREQVPARDGTPAYVTTHFNLFRIADRRLAEHWHSVHTPPGADVLPPDQGGPQPVVGALGAEQARWLASSDPRLARNKRLVFDLWRDVVDAGHEQLASRYVASRLIDHHPGAGAGLRGFRQYFSQRPDQPVQTWIGASVVAIVAEGNLVALVTRQEHPHPARPGRTYTTTWFDLFRVDDGRVVEHWDDAAPDEAPTPSAW